LIFVQFIATFSAIRLVPALPGATYIFVTFGLWESFQTIACSLAPFPITRTFRVVSSAKLNYSFAPLVASVPLGSIEFIIAVFP
jgi:hypothetical protein